MDRDDLVMYYVFIFGAMCMFMATVGFIDHNIEIDAHIVDTFAFGNGQYSFAEIFYSDSSGTLQTQLIPISTNYQNEQITIKYPVWNVNNVVRGRIWISVENIVKLFKVGLTCMALSACFLRF